MISPNVAQPKFNKLRDIPGCDGARGNTPRGVFTLSRGAIGVNTALGRSYHHFPHGDYLYNDYLNNGGGSTLMGNQGLTLIMPQLLSIYGLSKKYSGDYLYKRLSNWYEYTLGFLSLVPDEGFPPHPPPGSLLLE